MHNYAGNPANFPTVPLVDDADLNPPTATNLDLTGQALADRTAYLRASQYTVDFGPSYEIFLTTSDVPVTCNAFDPINLKWMCAGLSVAAGHILFVQGRGQALNWTLMGGGVGPYTGGLAVSLCRGIEPAVSNKWAYAAVIGGVTGPGDLSVLPINTTTPAFGSISLPLGVTTDVTHAYLVSVSGAVAIIVGASGTPHTGILYSTDHGVTWTNTGMGFGTPVQEWLVAQSVPGAGTIMAIPKLAVSGGTGYLTSTDGITWTPRLGLTALPLLATETPTTLVYGVDSAGVACWILTTFESVSTLTKTYRSYDGISWAAFSNTLPALIAFAEMAAVGQQLCGVLFETALTRVLYSLDGGSTWQTTNVEAEWATAVSLAGSNNQFFLATDVIVNLSRCYGPPGGIGAK